MCSVEWVHKNLIDWVIPFDHIHKVFQCLICGYAYWLPALYCVYNYKVFQTSYLYVAICTHIMIMHMHTAKEETVLIQIHTSHSFIHDPFCIRWNKLLSIEHIHFFYHLADLITFKDILWGCCSEIFLFKLLTYICF